MFTDWKVPFRTVIETTPDGMLVCDPHGVLVMVNAEGERMFGYDKDELLGKSVDVLVPDYVRPSHNRRVESYTAAPKVRLIGAVAIELKGRRKDGSEFPCEIGLSPIESEHGRMIIASIRDISERRALEAEALKARELAEAASAAKSEFLASMSHELRTPLNAILGFAQLLEHDRVNPLDARQLARLGHVLRGGEHLLRLIDDVLDLSRIEDGRLRVSAEPVEVADVVREVARTLEPMAARQQIEITVEPFGGSAVVTADRTRLVQILMNFGSNAIKYGKQRGTVTLRIAELGSLVRISVTDDGGGIREDALAKIFEPFQRAGQETGPIEGTGIGLTISRRLAALMGATIDVTSKVGTGSTFWIDLSRRGTQPAARPHAEFDLASSRLAAGPARHKVLYVEDNPANTAFMQALCSELASLELLTSTTAEHGLELVHSHHPDLVIMDINLPGMDGYEAVRALRFDEDTRHIPVIGLSAAAFVADTKRAQAAHFDRYLTKPIKLAELAGALEALLLP